MPPSGDLLTSLMNQLPYFVGWSSKGKRLPQRWCQCLVSEMVCRWSVLVNRNGVHPREHHDKPLDLRPNTGRLRKWWKIKKSESQRAESCCKSPLSGKGLGKVLGLDLQHVIFWSMSSPTSVDLFLIPTGYFIANHPDDGQHYNSLFYRLNPLFLAYSRNE